MPYRNSSGNFELARRLGHVSIVDNPFVKERLKSFRTQPKKSKPEDNFKNIISRFNAKPLEELPNWLIAFDGSPDEVAIDEDFPSTQIGYLQIAGVLVNLQRLLSEARESLVDPSEIRSSTDKSLIPLVLPGSNVCTEGFPNVRESWRYEIYKAFLDYSIEDQSLFQVLKSLLSGTDKIDSQGAIILEKCPSTLECSQTWLSVPDNSSTCPECGGPVYPTDCLRIHEEVQGLQANLTALGRLMNVLEHVAMIGYLDYFRRHRPQVFAQLAFVLDGPLAIFGPPAWIHRYILSYIHELSSSLEANGYMAPVILGVEKTGHFVEHATQLRNVLPKRNLLMLPDRYIFERILTTREMPNATYGRDTYYGQKFIYRNAKDSMLVFTVPTISKEGSESYRAEKYANMGKAINLLDRLGTILYQDAIIPVALAHSAAAIPLQTGTKVLKLLSQTTVINYQE